MQRGPLAPLAKFSRPVYVYSIVKTVVQVQTQYKLFHIEITAL